MVWEKCSVVLNTGIEGVFYTSDIVTGTINIEFKKKHKLEYIKCEIIGLSEANWTRSMATMPYIKIYSEKVNVFYLQYNIINTEIVKEVGPGLYTYDIHFILPEDIPSTFKTSIAKVKYYVKITGKGICTFKKTENTPFTVVGKINLNNLDTFMTPFYTEFCKTLWKSGRICMCLKTYKGFASRQTLPFEIVICNENKTKISRIKVSLIQKLEYNISSGHANQEIVISKTEYKSCKSDITEICHFYMTIPETVPSSINQSQPMIDIKYVLRVEISFLFHFSHYEDVPVTIASETVNHYDTEKLKECLLMCFIQILNEPLKKFQQVPNDY